MLKNGLNLKKQKDVYFLSLLLWNGKYAIEN